MVAQGQPQVQISQNNNIGTKIEKPKVERESIKIKWLICSKRWMEVRGCFLKQVMLNWIWKQYVFVWWVMAVGVRGEHSKERQQSEQSQRCEIV